MKIIIRYQFYFPSDEMKETLVYSRCLQDEEKDRLSPITMYHVYEDFMIPPDLGRLEQVAEERAKRMKKNTLQSKQNRASPVVKSKFDDSSKMNYVTNREQCVVICKSTKNRCKRLAGPTGSEMCTQHSKIYYSKIYCNL